jgi:hypothetical protein
MYWKESRAGQLRFFAVGRYFPTHPVALHDSVSSTLENPYNGLTISRSTHTDRKDTFIVLSSFNTISPELGQIGLVLIPVPWTRAELVPFS